jgi:hypothetical protein
VDVMSESLSDVCLNTVCIRATGILSEVYADCTTPRELRLPFLTMEGKH